MPLVTAPPSYHALGYGAPGYHVRRVTRGTVCTISKYSIALPLFQNTSQSQSIALLFPFLFSGIEMCLAIESQHPGYLNVVGGPN